MVGRRRRADGAETPARSALEEVLRSVDAARDSLAAARPRRRGEGAPLAEALAGFEAGLAGARDGMPGWRRPETGDLWAACAEALEECRRRAEGLRLSPSPPEGYEQLYLVLADLLDPLEAFDRAAEALRLRRR